ncbi:MAG TPA: serine/threonine-protein kinase [Polyangiaceae bacterium]|nr:serine/threonine-protein kinase [Polyangiaceae bacterium]
MDPDVARLVHQQRLTEAARLASERGDPATASALHERACDWRAAGIEALRAGQAGRALELAALAGDDVTAEQALAAVARSPGAGSVAARLEERGRHGWAARLLEACRREADAARAWERAGDARRAAALLERAGQPVEAARVLEAALRREPRAWGVAVALGGLLGRFGRWQSAARVLQRVPPEAGERREALAALVPALEQLGLDHAAAEAARELASSGGAAQVDPAVQNAGACVAPASGAGGAVVRAQPRLFGRYELVREVASSATARVLECVDLVRGGRVAVKLLAAVEARGAGRDALARFEREARVMKAMAHPNVVPLLEWIPDAPAIVLAWMAGGTLEQRLAEGPLAPARAAEVTAAVLSALGEAHRLGVLHRDVKPTNVLFDEGGVARLADFGVAHLGETSTTATAGVFGTLGYMSPEQRQGRPATPRSDVFAAGVMLREMLTGERPCPGDPSLRPPSAAHRELDTRHDAVVASMIADDPDARPADAFEARALLASVPWPAAVCRPPEVARRDGHRAPEGHDERLETRADGVQVDSWTGRPIETVAATDRVLSRARAFALADHPALQAVWRVDRAAPAIWLEHLAGRPRATPLSDADRARLRAALVALHATGVAHGRVDWRHIASREDGVVLRFEPEHDPTATADLDWIALARLEA